MVDGVEFGVLVRLRRAEQGGRTRPVRSNYRCNCDNGDRLDSGLPPHHDATFLFDDDELAPGDEGRAVMIAHRPEFWQMVRPGDDVIMCEGRKVVGVARVFAAPIL